MRKPRWRNRTPDATAFKLPAISEPLPKEVMAFLKSVHESESIKFWANGRIVTGKLLREYDNAVDSEKCSDSRNNWFEFATYCIPKSISEPWLGDVRDIREDMHLKRYSKRAIAYATVSQFALLFLNWGIHKAFDMLMPFKKSRVD